MSPTFSVACTPISGETMGASQGPATSFPRACSRPGPPATDLALAWGPGPAPAYPRAAGVSPLPACRTAHMATSSPGPGAASHSPWLVPMFPPPGCDYRCRTNCRAAHLSRVMSRVWLPAQQPWGGTLIPETPPTWKGAPTTRH